MSTEDTPLPWPALDLHLLRRPEQVSAANRALLSGRNVGAVHISEGASTALAIDFDSLQNRLRGLPRMFLELDGSFMWAGESHARPWRIDGMIYENAQSVQWVEIKGQCPLGDWDQLLDRLGHSTDPLLVLWLPEQIFLDVATMRCFWDKNSKS